VDFKLKTFACFVFDLKKLPVCRKWGKLSLGILIIEGILITVL
jgi:hypothetical protein